MQKNVIENIHAIGDITARFYDQSCLKDWQRAFNKMILRLRSRIPNIMRFYILGTLAREDRKFNVICHPGFNAICRRLVGDITYSGQINKALLGTGVGTASSNDTQLISESYRNDIASGTDNSNIALLTCYFSEEECSGVFTEFGNCIDGGAGVNTGQLWSHLTGLNWAKDNTVVLVISCKYTFISA
jgi:hypothetical protein